MNSFKVLSEKIGEILEIFDISFFISGAATTSAIIFFIHNMNYFKICDLFDSNILIVIIIVCYILGLISFSIGRFIRKNTIDLLFDNNNMNYNEIKKIAKFTKYVEIEEANKEIGTHSTFVTRLWATVRDNENVTTSYKLLLKYWTLGAAFDGLVFSSFVWFLIYVFLILNNVLNDIYFIVLPPSILLIGAFCVYEANRYIRFQKEELIETVLEMFE